MHHLLTGKYWNHITPIVISFFSSLYYTHIYFSTVHDELLSTNIVDVQKFMVSAMTFYTGKDVSKVIDYTLVMHHLDGDVSHIVASGDDSFPLVQVFLDDLKVFSGWKLFTDQGAATAFIRQLKPPTPDAK